MSGELAMATTGCSTVSRCQRGQGERIHKALERATTVGAATDFPVSKVEFSIEADQPTSCDTLTSKASFPQSFVHDIDRCQRYKQMPSSASGSVSCFLRGMLELSILHFSQTLSRVK